MFIRFRRLTLSAPVTAVIGLLMGILFIVMPGASKIILCRLSCLCLTVIGAICILDFFSGDRTVPDLPGLILGAAAAGFGVYGILRPRTANKLLLTVLGILLLIVSLGALLRALSLSQIGYPLWRLHAIASGATLLFAVSVILHPVFYGNLVMRILGICCAANAASDLLVIRRISLD